VPELPSEVAHSPGSRASVRRRLVRRYLTGLSAAGVTAAVILTGAVSDASASPASSAASRVVTLTNSSTAPTGHLTLQAKYRLGRSGRNRVISVTYSGSSNASIKHPALIVSLRPVPGLLPPRGVQVKVGKRQVHIPVFGFTVILRLHNSRSFSGALPRRVLALLRKSFAGPRRRLRIGDVLLSATVASVVRRHKGQFQVSAPVGLQVGVLLGPILP
jgi:hypothetical protein